MPDRRLYFNYTIGNGFLFYTTKILWKTFETNFSYSILSTKKKKTIKRGRIEWMTNRLMDTDGFIEYCLNLAKINNVFMISNV